MSTNEFDRLIAKKVSQVSYDYDTSDWEKLTIQLAAARKKRRAMVLAFAYLSSGIAASVAIFLFVAPMLSKKGVPAAQYASQIKTPPPAPSALSANSGVKIQSAVTQYTRHYKSPVAINHKKQEHLLSDTATYNASAIADNSHTNTSMQPAKKTIDTLSFEETHRQHGYEEPMTFIDETGNKPEKKINISVAGGINYGTINTGYAVGAAVDKKLSSKFGVEVTLAYVGNSASTPGSTVNQIPPFSPPFNGSQPKPSPVSAVTSPLNYLQCAPMADYSLSKKITLSAGADLQRLLQDHDVTILYNDNTKVAPLVDVGMLLRTEYAIFPRLKAGLSYRLGANNIVSPGNNYIDRNYMQVQLKYKLH
ncbi:MAG TPA: outer membrane beta-barrel protein [Flavipsychrobacter sp.]|nr:outer membrane beta-barrel protein [Flavipsychrobacter sp.]